MDTQTRHALKQDGLVDATRTSVDWFQDHRSTILRAALAAVVLLVIVIAAVVVYSKRSSAADIAFGAAMDTYNAPLAQPGQLPTPGQKTFDTGAQRSAAAYQQFASVANQYSFFSAGKTARYFAGITAAEMGQTGPAENYLSKVADGHDSALASLANLALANLYQQTGRTSQAVVLYNQLIAKPTNTVPADAAKLQLAELYEKTNPAEAKRMYALMKGEKTAAGQIATQKLAAK